MADNLYTEIILDLYKNPQNKGRLEKFNLETSGGNPICGDQVTFTALISNDIVEDIKFFASGCAISTASDSLLTEMVKGKKISEVKKITPEKLFEQLGGIIQTRIKCALLGLIVLKKGIEEYEKSGKKSATIKGIVV
ncbi:MAG TPA: SUF system NifU family Fe-S cluster assembly protein [archaeon]|nr:SUF system NifU family Fe-S cluster assembly protein [archaeon]